MVDQHGKSLWERVCATVNRLGHPRAARKYPLVEVIADRSLDLHGLTIHVAFTKTRAFIEHTPHTAVVIVTGLSGQINYEFRDWCLQWHRVRSVTAINGGGAYAVTLRPLSD